MELWLTRLLDPTTAPNIRATALHDNLPVDSPWRQAVLRHDARLWQLFPAECALFTTEEEDHQGHTSDDGGGSDSDPHASSPMEHVQHPVSIPQLQVLAADICTCLATYASASSGAAASECTDVDAKGHVVQTLAQVRALLSEFDVAAARHEEVATLALESARMQHQAMQELSRVVRQAADDVATAVLNVKTAVDSGSRDEVDAAAQQRGTVRGMAVATVHAALRKCVECGMDAKYLEESSTGSLARTFLDKMEDDADTEATTGTMVQVVLLWRHL